VSTPSRKGTPSSGRSGGTVTSGSARVVGGAVLLDVSVVLPATLSGALAVQMRSDLGFTEQSLGLIVSTFFAAGAVTAILARRQLDRLGGRRTAWVAAFLAALALSSIAGLVTTWPLLLVALLVAGSGLGLMVPATSMLLAAAAPVTHLGRLMGIKQAAMPLAMLAAGTAVPALALTVGWRWAFGGGLLLLAPGLWLVSRTGVEGRPGPDSVGRVDAPERHRGRGQGLRWPVGIAAFFATLLPGGVTAFLVLGLVEAGLRPAVAGIVFAFAAVACVLVRLVGGVLIDRYASDGYVPIAVLLLGGGAGAGLLALGRPGLSTVGALLALALGYGWPGIMFFLAVNGRPESPGSASVIIHVGGLIGAATGPAVTGMLIGFFGWGTAWAALGISSMLGALTLAFQRPR
jgi:predicted MFS family arabinose efflux permease